MVWRQVVVPHAARCAAALRWMCQLQDDPPVWCQSACLLRAGCGLPWHVLPGPGLNPSWMSTSDMSTAPRADGGFQGLGLHTFVPGVPWNSCSCMPSGTRRVPSVRQTQNPRLRRPGQLGKHCGDLGFLLTLSMVRSSSKARLRTACCHRPRGWQHKLTSTHSANLSGCVWNSAYCCGGGGT